MFTGIIQEIAKVSLLTLMDNVLCIELTTSNNLGPVLLGASICVNGVCLTAKTILSNKLTFDCGQETLLKTNLGQLTVGDAVNIETALTLNSAINGHIVQGHVDGIASITHINHHGKSTAITFKTTPSLHQLLFQKSSICIDGVSLTIANLDKHSFTIAFIPYTKEHTIVQYYQNNQKVNIEIDILTKSIQQLLQRHANDNPQLI